MECVFFFRNSVLYYLKMLKIEKGLVFKLKHIRKMLYINFFRTRFYNSICVFCITEITGPKSRVCEMHSHLSSVLNEVNIPKTSPSSNAKTRLRWYLHTTTGEFRRP